MTAQEVVGGQRNGVQLDPVTYLISNLFARFAGLGEESRISAMNDMWNLRRKHGEPIDMVLARYETVRQRAAMGGNFAMSIEAQAAQILHVIGTRPHELMVLLRPLVAATWQTPQNMPSC